MFMEGKEENYHRILWILLAGFILNSLLLTLFSINSVECWITANIGGYAFLLIKLVPWGGFGALMKASFLSAKDKHLNYKMKTEYEKDNDKEAPNYPDDYDVFMYLLYIMTGMSLAILSAFLLETGIEYVSENPLSPIEDKLGLFAIFAFYAGYSQSDLVGKLRKKADDSS
jgi:hypothetical protein